MIKKIFAGVLAVLFIASVAFAATKYSINRTNVTTSSLNFDFGFTAEHGFIRAAATNTVNLCVDFDGATAVCPTANTAGTYVLEPGEYLSLDGMRVESFSVIAASSSSQGFKVLAWR